MEQFVVTDSQVDILKRFAPVLVEAFEYGACFFTSDLEKATFKVASTKWDFPTANVGTTNKPGGVADTIIKAGQVKIQNLDRSMYGIRITALGGPIYADDKSAITGAWYLLTPRLHMLARAFNEFAPIVAAMLPEGGVLYITDKEKISYRQGSAKFDLPSIHVDYKLTDDDTPTQVMRSGKMFEREIDASSAWGVPLKVTCSPMIDDHTNEIVGSFSMAIPRQLSIDLKSMATNLSEGLEQIAAAMQEMAAATAEVTQNQISLNTEITSISKISEEINEVMAFIKQIADETKMLGLNAAIEAARAGDVGRGFGVVAGEIRNLSDQSRETVVDIRNLTSKIQSSILDTINSSDATVKTSEQQAAAVQEVNASIEEITSMAEHLKQLADSL